MTIKSIALILSVLIFLCSHIHGQELSTVDSLKQLLPGSADSVRITLLNEISYQLRDADPRQAINFADSAKQLAMDSNDSTAIAKSYYVKGTAWIRLSPADSAVYYLNKGLAISQSIKDSGSVAELYDQIAYAHYKAYLKDKSAEFFLIAARWYEKVHETAKKAKCLNNAGLSYWGNGELEEALNLYKKALKIFQQIDDKYWQGLVLNNIGTIYWGIGSYNMALKYFIDAIEYRKLMNDKNGLVLTLNNIGLVYQEWKKFDKSLEFHQRALAISDSANNKFGKAYSQINIGNYYIHSGKYDAALGFFYNAQENYNAENQIIGVSLSLKHIGDIYKEKKEYDKALKYYKKSFVSADSVNSRRRVTIALYATAEIYALQGYLDKALITSQKSLKIALKEKYRDDLAKNYALIASIYERQHKYKESLEAFKLSKVWHDSLFNQEKMNEYADLQVRFSVAQKDKENELLRKDNEIQRLNYAREHSLRNSLMVIIFLAALVVALVILRYRMTQKTNRVLQQQNDEIQVINKEKEILIGELRDAFANVKELNGLLPICSHCKKIRDDKGYWNEVEKYVSTHTDAQFSHGLCPECFDQSMKEIDAL